MPAGPQPPAAHVVQAVVYQRINPNWQRSDRRVARVLHRVVRAGSVVECINSVICMHQACHRTLTQPLMDLLSNSQQPGAELATFGLAQ